MIEAINKLSNIRIDLCEKIDNCKTDKSEFFRELDSLDHCLECSLGNYKFMYKFIKERGFDNVVDIGCAYGFQNEFFKDMSYTGIDDEKLNFYRENEQNVHYLVGTYPFKLPKINYFKRAVAISNLCIGWECYKQNDDEFDKQFKAISKDFKASLLYMPYERINTLEKYFKNIAIYKEHKGLVHTAYFYCWNDKVKEE